MVTYADWHDAIKSRQAAWVGAKTCFDNSFYLNELLGEIGEAQNVIKKMYRAANNVKGSWATVDDLFEELGDVVICCRNLGKSMELFLDDRHVAHIQPPERAGTWLYNDWGIYLNVVGGRLANSFLFEPRTQNKTTYAMKIEGIMAAARHVGEKFAPDVNLELRTRMKWNATSEKYGFSQRIEERIG